MRNNNVMVFNMATGVEEHYINLSAKDALISSYLVSIGQSVSDLDARNSASAMIRNGKASIGLGDFATIVK